MSVPEFHLPTFHSPRPVPTASPSLLNHTGPFQPGPSILYFASGHKLPMRFQISPPWTRPHILQAGRHCGQRPLVRGRRSVGTGVGREDLGCWHQVTHWCGLETLAEAILLPCPPPAQQDRHRATPLLTPSSASGYWDTASAPRYPPHAGVNITDVAMLLKPAGHLKSGSHPSSQGPAML